MQGKPSESLNKDLHKKQNSLPALKVDNNKGDANGFQEETAHSCPDHNQWRAKFEVEVLVADNLTVSLHASTPESPASPARLQTSTMASSQEMFE